MKIYISADIEGITGVTHWNETEMQKPESNEFRDQMTAEVGAACEGALEAGATEILLKDAHDTARNIHASRLPQQVRLIRGWSGHPFMMAQELDESFAGIIMIGYHSRASAASSPLAHTMTGKAVYVKINDHYASEFLINAYTAALCKVPVVFVSGDRGLCDEVAAFDARIGTAAVKTGIGDSTVSIHPAVAVARIRQGVAAALTGKAAKSPVPLPPHFAVEIRFKNHPDAYHAAFFPGVTLKEPHTVQFGGDNWFEVLRAFAFLF